MSGDKGKGKALPTGQTTLDVFLKRDKNEDDGSRGVSVSTPPQRKRPIDAVAVSPKAAPGGGVGATASGGGSASSSVSPYETHSSHSAAPVRTTFDQQLASAIGNPKTQVVAPMATEGEGGAVSESGAVITDTNAEAMDVDEAPVDTHADGESQVPLREVVPQRRPFEPHGDGGAPEPAAEPDEDDDTAALDAVLAAAAEQEEEAAAAAEAQAADAAEIAAAEAEVDASSPPPPMVHTILVDADVLALGSVPESDPPPPAGPEADAWDDEHLKLPCSPVAGVAMPGGGIVPRWEVVVAALSSPLADSEALSDAILRYNPKMVGKWDWTCFNHLFESELTAEESRDFFERTLPRMAELALALPSVCPAPIPLLRQGWPGAVTLSQMQIACLLCHSFFCTFPGRRSKRARDKMPRINFDELFNGWDDRAEQKVQKLKCFISYFAQVTRRMPTGAVTVVRHCLTLPPDWAEDATHFGDLVVMSDGKIEDSGPGVSFTDFANRYVGGGVLGRGAVQEEILFAIAPELVVSCLVCEVLLSREALVIRGADRYSDYSGYASDFRWAGPHRRGTTSAISDEGGNDTATGGAGPALGDTVGSGDGGTRDAASAARDTDGGSGDNDVLTFDGVPGGGGNPAIEAGDGFSPPLARDHLRRSESQLIVIDALMMNRWDMQYKEKWILRELNKAYCGFASPHGQDSLGITAHPIATGNWGCGAFGGEPHLKALLQLMACARAERACLYYTFGDESLCAKLQLAHRLLREYDVCVGEVWKWLSEYCAAFLRNRIDVDVLRFIIEKCNSL